MSQFEFSTKEEREAWRVTRPALDFYQSIYMGVDCCIKRLDEAASRFDEREKTCGIEFGSKQYAVLCSCTDKIEWSSAFDECNQKGLIYKQDNNWQWQLTDRGREVLANLNAMCNA